MEVICASSIFTKTTTFLVLEGDSGDCFQNRSERHTLRARGREASQCVTKPSAADSSSGVVGPAYADAGLAKALSSF